jgi:hypothetical protein
MRILVCILTLMHTPASCLCYLLEMYINHWRHGDESGLYPLLELTKSVAKFW